MAAMKRYRNRPKRRRLYSDCLLLLCVCAAAATTTAAATASSSDASSSSPSSSRRLSPFLGFRRGFFNDEDFSEEEGTASHFFGGRGCEFDLFDTRGVATSSSSPSYSFDGGTFPRAQASSSPSSPSSTSSSNSDSNNPYSSNGFYRTYSTSSSSSSPPTTNRVGGRAYNTYSGNRRRRNRFQQQQQQRFFLEPLQDWWSTHISPNIKSWPKLSCKVEPTTTLKIRKTFRPIGTIVKLGADFNTQLGVWQFKSSWEDAIIGGKLTLAGRELQLTKSWQLSMGGAALDDLVTRLRFRAAVDLQTWKAYVRVGFRTERLSPINVLEGFTILRQVPLDGNKGHVKLEVKANLSLPEPEIEYSTETQRSLVGMGDIEISVEELNLLLDY